MQYNVLMNVQELVDQIRPFKPQRIILFGSQVYGKPRPDSDFDVAIVKNTDIPFHDRLVEIRKLVRTTTPIDFFVFTESELASAKHTNPFVAEIVTKGKVIYEQ